MVRPLASQGRTEAESFQQIRLSQQAWRSHFLQRSVERRTRRELAQEKRSLEKAEAMEAERTYRATGEPPERVMRTREVEASKAFYRQLGYAEYGGRYQPFEIPEGYRVTRVQETKAGLAVQLEKEPTEDVGLAERIMGWQTPWALTREQKMVMQPSGIKQYGDPVQFTAGVIASVEAPAYSIGRLAGFETPRPPPTTTGGVVGSLVESVSKGRVTESESLKKAREYGPAYGFGTLVGDILIARGTGKLTQKVVSKTVQPAAQKWLTKRYLAKGPLAWKGLPEKAVMKITGAKPYVAPQVVSIPSPHTRAGAWGAQQAWRLTGPKTAILDIGGVTGASARTQAWVSDKLVKGFLTGGLSYATVQEELGKVKPEMPYIPRTEPVQPTVSRLSYLAFAGLTGLRMMPTSRVKAGGILAQPVRMEQPVIPSYMPAQYQRARAFQTPVQEVRAEQASDIGLVQDQALLQQEFVRAFEPYRTPTRRERKLPSKRKKKKRRKKRKGVRIGRQRRVYPVMTPSQVMELMF